MLRDRRGDLARCARLLDAEERELVRDRRLEATAVAAGALAAADLLDRRLALERHDRLVLAHERDGERAAREAVAAVAAATAAAARCRCVDSATCSACASRAGRSDRRCRSSRYATSARVPSGETAMPRGSRPSAVRHFSLPVAVSNATSVRSAIVVTITVLRSGDSAMPYGSAGVLHERGDLELVADLDDRDAIRRRDRRRTPACRPGRTPAGRRSCRSRPARSPCRPCRSGSAGRCRRRSRARRRRRPRCASRRDTPPCARGGLRAAERTAEQLKARGD